MGFPAWDAARNPVTGSAWYELYLEPVRSGRTVIKRGRAPGWAAWRPDRPTYPKNFSDLLEALEWAAEGMKAPMPSLEWETLPVEGSAEYETRVLSDGSKAADVLAM